MTCTYLANLTKRLRELSSTKTGSYPHEFLCRTNCSACADYQPCNTVWVRARLCKLQNKGALDSQPQVIKFTSYLPMVSGLLPASSTTKTGRHDIAEILLKVALNTKPVYGVYISHLIRHSRACVSYRDFLDRGLLITMTLTNQGFLLLS